MSLRSFGRLEANSDEVPGAARRAASVPPVASVTRPTSKPRHAEQRPFAATAEERSGWLAHGLTAAAVGVLGLALAGTIAIAGPRNESAAGWRDMTGPDTSRAVPVSLGQADSESEGHSETGVDPDQRGTLESFDRRRSSTSREAVRKEISKAQTANQARKRGQDLNQRGTEAQQNNRNLSQRERDEALEEAKRKTEAEAKRQAEEERRKREAERRKREAERRAQGGDGSLTPPGEDYYENYDLPADGSVAPPLPSGRYVIGARWGAWGSWSRYHTGQDLPAAYGTPIYAVKAGVVVPGAGGWAGISVAIRHTDGATLYAHMSSRTVSPGQTVEAGQIIGYVGCTGRCFGAHLHLEYYPPGTKIGDVYTSRDPMAWLQAQGLTL